VVDILKILVILAILVQTISCSKKPTAQTYFEREKVVLPDSARVKAMISVSQNEAKEKLSAVLFAVPDKRYRLELSGSFGFSAASILWKEGKWRIILPQDERYMEGVGDCVFVPIYGGVDIHKFSLLFFGQKVGSLDCGEKEWDHFKLEYGENFASVVSGSDSLKLEIRDINPKAEWQSGVWNLNAPDKYIRISP
jgi:hypothetical protein